METGRSPARRIERQVRDDPHAQAQPNVSLDHVRIRAVSAMSGRSPAAANVSFSDDGPVKLNT